MLCASGPPPSRRPVRQGRLDRLEQETRMSQRPTSQAPGLNRRRIGDAVVTVLNDGYLDLSFELLADITVA